MALPDGTSISLASSFGYALEGVRHAASGRNFKIQSAFAVAAIALCTAFTVAEYAFGFQGVGVPVEQWCIVIACIGLVLGGECFNTAIEAVVDIASPEYSELAKHAKDCAAGAVILFSIASFAVGVALFLPRIITVFLALIA